jgi:hypothetical protein
MDEARAMLAGLDAGDAGAGAGDGGLDAGLVLKLVATDAA